MGLRFIGLLVGLGGLRRETDKRAESGNGPRVYRFIGWSGWPAPINR